MLGQIYDIFRSLFPLFCFSVNCKVKCFLSVSVMFTFSWASFPHLIVFFLFLPPTWSVHFWCVCMCMCMCVWLGVAETWSSRCNHLLFTTSAYVWKSWGMLDCTLHMCECVCVCVFCRFIACLTRPTFTFLTYH